MTITNTGISSIIAVNTGVQYATDENFREDATYKMYTDPNIQVLEGVSVQGAYTPTDPSQQYIDRARFNEAVDTVSYTHLTLPTILRV